MTQSGVAPDPRLRGAFKGYASVFNIMDGGRDIVVKGAFLRSLRERGARGIKLLWQHNPSEPIGVIDRLYEDDHGLFISGRLLLDIARAREAYALLCASVLDGLSIGYKAVRSRVNPKNGTRLLLDVDLWEVSLVTFPMQAAARITNVKSEDWQDVMQSVGTLMSAVTAATRQRKNHHHNMI